jgi:hypothetical protein
VLIRYLVDSGDLGRNCRRKSLSVSCSSILCRRSNENKMDLVGVFGLLSTGGPRNCTCSIEGLLKHPRAVMHYYREKRSKRTQTRRPAVDGIRPDMCAGRPQWPFSRFVEFARTTRTVWFFLTFYLRQNI